MLQGRQFAAIMFTDIVSLLWRRSPIVYNGIYNFYCCKTFDIFYYHARICIIDKRTNQSSPDGQAELRHEHPGI